MRFQLAVTLSSVFRLRAGSEFEVAGTVFQHGNQWGKSLII